MKAVIQRVSRCSVFVESNNQDRKQTASIGKGLLVLICFEQDDTNDTMQHFAVKIPNLRIFEDDSGKMNKSITDINGDMCVVSQFTLCANCDKGNRPSYENAMDADNANKMYDEFISLLQTKGLRIYTGKFGAKMFLDFVNDGPVTIILENKK